MYPEGARQVAGQLHDGRLVPAGLLSDDQTNSSVEVAVDEERADSVKQIGVMAEYFVYLREDLIEGSHNNPAMDARLMSSPTRLAPSPCPFARPWLKWR